MIIATPLVKDVWEVGNSTTLAAFGRHVRQASEQVTELKDVDTADLFTEIARGIDKWHWFVETSQQPGN